MDDQWKMAGKIGVVLLVVFGLAFGAVTTFSQGSIIGGQDKADKKNQSQNPTGEQVSWNSYKDLVGLNFGSQVAGESVVLIPQSTSASNYGSADVTTVGADSDESDTTELFSSAEVQEGEDYYKFTTFGSAVKSGLPDSGTYKVAVIGSGIGNKYVNFEIPSQISKFRVEQSAPLTPLAGVDVLEYASASNVTVKNTVVQDGGTTIALSNDFTSESDSNIDGSVTGIREYDVAQGVVAQFGEVQISGVNSTVSEVTVTVMADGKQVFSQSDSDFSDNQGLDDGVELKDKLKHVDALDTVTVETSIKYDDSSMTSAGDLVTVALDDTDADGDSSDGSYGFTELATTWTGY